MRPSNSERVFFFFFFLHSVFQDVFLLVRPVKDKTNGETKYSLACISKDYVPEFKPVIPEPALFSLDEVFRNLILTKGTSNA